MSLTKIYNCMGERRNSTCTSMAIMDDDDDDDVISDICYIDEKIYTIWREDLIVLIYK